MMIKSIVTYSNLYNQPREQGWRVCYTLSKKFNKNRSSSKNRKKLASFYFLMALQIKKYILYIKLFVRRYKTLWIGITLWKIARVDYWNGHVKPLWDEIFSIVGSNPTSSTIFLRKVNSDDSEARLESDAYLTVWGLTPQLSANWLFEIGVIK